MNLFKHIPLLATSLLLAACTSENTLETTTPPDEGGTSDGNTREVLLSLKNKLQVIPVETKAAGDPIATTAENHIYSLDVYVFGSKTEDGDYTFLQQFYYREDARQTVAGDYATSFTLNTGADNSTALLRMKKGLFVKVYCIANSTKLIQADGTEFDDFKGLIQSNPGQAGNAITDGVPTESDFKTFHTPALQADVADDVLLTPLPMTGAYTTPLDLTDFSVSARTQLGFKLTRMVARFDVTNDAEKSKFTIQSVSMGNGRTGASYFPVKVLGSTPAVGGDLITYPEREYTADQTTAKPKGMGIFYSYPSPVDDGGYLILSGTYAANKTEEIPVTYKVPFKPAADATGNYIEVAYNHRYTVNITEADEYHLDFTLKVSDWTDEGDIDDYKPENDFTKDALALSGTGNTADVKLLSDGNIVMDASASSTGTLSFTIAGNHTDPSAIVEKLDYAEGDEWLVIDGERTTVTKASTLTTFKYKMFDGIAGMDDFRAVTIRLSNKASGKNLDIRVIPTDLSGPEITLEAVEGSSYDPATNTVTITNTNDQSFKLKVSVVTLGDEGKTTGSSVVIGTPSWLTVDETGKTEAEGIYTFTLGSVQSPGTTNTLTFTSTATNGTTVVHVALAEPVTP